MAPRSSGTKKAPAKKVAAAKKAAAPKVEPLLDVDSSDFVTPTIAIPSAGRPGCVLAGQCLPTDTFLVCVPEAELADYREAQPELTFDAHPDDVIGLPAKRQWMYDKYGDIVMFDDDMFEIIHVEHASGDPHCTISGYEAYDVVCRVATDAKAIGSYLFGFGDPDVRNYQDIAPFSFTGWVIGSALGLLAGSGLTFNPDIVAADDFWIGLLNAREHRIAYQDLRYAPNCKATFTALGGTSAGRNMATEESDFKILRKYFGDAVQRKQPTARAKVRHEWQRTVFLPF